MRSKLIKGFQTGDMVRAILATGVHAGTWTGRVAIRAAGSFNVQTATGVRQGISWKFCRIIQRSDGYGYSTTLNKKGAASSPCLKAGVSAAGFLMNKDTRSDQRSSKRPLALFSALRGRLRACILQRLKDQVRSLAKVAHSELPGFAWRFSA
jgi:hypothetical protein